jgi:hypothetical protein
LEALRTLVVKGRGDAAALLKSVRIPGLRSLSIRERTNFPKLSKILLDSHASLNFLEIKFYRFPMSSGKQPSFLDFLRDMRSLKHLSLHNIHFTASDPLFRAMIKARTFLPRLNRLDLRYGSTYDTQLMDKLNKNRPNLRVLDSLSPDSAGSDDNPAARRALHVDSETDGELESGDEDADDMNVLPDGVRDRQRPPSMVAALALGLGIRSASSPSSSSNFGTDLSTSDDGNSDADTDIVFGHSSDVPDADE